MEGAVHLPPGVVALSHPYPFQWWFAALHPRWTRFYRSLLFPSVVVHPPILLVGNFLIFLSVFLVFDSVFFFFKVVCFVICLLFTRTSMFTNHNTNISQNQRTSVLPHSFHTLPPPSLLSLLDTVYPVFQVWISSFQFQIRLIMVTLIVSSMTSR